MKIRNKSPRLTRLTANRAPRKRKAPNPLKIDPTRTATLRRAFTNEINKRFALLKGRIIKLVEDDDAFGLIGRDKIENFNPDQERDAKGRFGSGGGTSSITSPEGKTVATHIEEAKAEADGHSLGSRIASSIGRGVRAGVSKILNLLDEEFKGGASLIVGGIKNRDPVSVLYGVSRAITSSICTETHEEVWENSLAQHSFGGAHGAGVVLSKVLTAGEQALLRGAAKALRAVGLRGPAANLEAIANALDSGPTYDTLSLADKAIVDLATEQALVALKTIYEGAGVLDKVSIPSSQEMQERITKRLIQPTTNDRWQAISDADKVEAFQEWLRSQLNETLTGMSNEELWRRYIQAGFKQGAGRSYDDVKAKAKGSQILDFYSESKNDFLASAFARPVAQDKVELLAGRAFDDLEGITDDMSLRMSRELTDGLIQGKSPHDVAKDITDEVDISRQRAETIARTEIIRAHAEGQLQALDDLGVEEVGVAVEWDTAKDGKVCELCQPLQGVVLKIDEARGMLPRHPNCLIGESIIRADDVLAILEAHYTGEIVEIITAKGRRVSTTLNHILLTEHGFLPARYLFEGIKIADTSMSDSLVDTPDDYTDKATIADVFATLSEDPLMLTECVPLATEDLHNDGGACDTEVNVVRPNRELWNERQAVLERVQDSLVSLQVCNVEGVLPTLSPDAQLLKRVAFIFDSSMGSARDSLALLNASLLHSEEHTLTTIAGSDSSIDESLVDCTPTATVSLRESQRTHPGVVQCDNFLSRQRGPIEQSMIGNDLSGSFQSPLDSFGLDAKLLADSEARDSGSMQLDKGFDEVVSLRLTHVVNLPVYDLQTQSTLYLVQGLVSSNCRCAWLPANVGEDDEDQKSTKKEVKGAIDDSVNKEVGEDGESDDSDWTGVDTTISKDRPESIFNEDTREGSDTLDITPQLLSLSEFLTNEGEGSNCGIGPGGFQPGNTCAKGGGEGASSLPSLSADGHKMLSTFKSARPGSSNAEQAIGQFKQMKKEEAEAVGKHLGLSGTRNQMLPHIQAALASRGKGFSHVALPEAAAIPTSTPSPIVPVKPVVPTTPKLVVTPSVPVAPAVKVGATKPTATKPARGSKKTADSSSRAGILKQIDADIGTPQREIVAKILRENSTEVGGVKVHGMAHSETMQELAIDGVRFRWPKGHEGPVAESIASIVRGEIPSKLWGAVREVTFCTQHSIDNSHWQRVYNDPLFRCRATGGDGGICVYASKEEGSEPSVLSKRTFSHEAGHTFAAKEWGGYEPSSESAYGRAQQAEPPVTEYGSHNRAEDFAEAIGEWTTTLGRERLRTQFPGKHAALSVILGHV